MTFIEEKPNNDEKTTSDRDPASDREGQQGPVEGDDDSFGNEFLDDMISKYTAKEKPKRLFVPIV